MDAFTIAARAGNGFYKTYVRNIRLAELREIPEHFLDPYWGFCERDYYFTYKGIPYRVNQYFCPNNNWGIYRYETVPVEFGRAITKEELLSIRERYKITDMDISGRFENDNSVIYGGYEKPFVFVEIRVDLRSAISLGKELKEKGIESNRCSLGRVNVRVR